MIAIVWQYQVKPEHGQEFERVYGADGDWARLFQRTEGYLGSELLRGFNGDYLTIDRWRSRPDFTVFLENHAEDYAALDARTRAWTEAETHLGTWGELDLVAGK